MPKALTRLTGTRTIPGTSSYNSKHHTRLPICALSPPQPGSRALEPQNLFGLSSKRWHRTSRITGCGVAEETTLDSSPSHKHAVPVTDLATTKATDNQLQGLPVQYPNEEYPVNTSALPHLASQTSSSPSLPQEQAQAAQLSSSTYPACKSSQLLDRRAVLAVIPALWLAASAPVHAEQHHSVPIANIGSVSRLALSVRPRYPVVSPIKPVPFKRPLTPKARSDQQSNSNMAAAATATQQGNFSAHAALLQQKLLMEFVTSGISVGTATAFTNPIDVVKTRVQLRSARLAGGARPPGLLSTGTEMVRQEGFSALYKGVVPAVARGLIYGGIRLGLYGPLKAAMAGADGSLTAYGKLLAALTTGAIASAVASPAELVKTRLQAKDNPHKTAGAIISHIVKGEGVVGLWKGAGPSTMRAALLTASQVAVYDEVKRAIMLQTGWGDNAGTHLACALISGLVVTTVTNPVDVIKTYMYMGGKTYSNSMAAAADIVKRDGLPGFMKGWCAGYARLGPQTVVTFMVAEWLRKLAGLEGL